ncbi:MAG: pyridoxamine 5'-phosphate oxidase family protein [Rhodocyclales bacterium]|nr:pyridoxamine 5'-phosphate oxidase family protein [Rhodocyclales bacterium]
MTLASVGADGPWAAAVFYAHDDLRLYFLSAPTSRHARNLAHDARVAATIQRDYDDWPGIRGLQLAGTVLEVLMEAKPACAPLYQSRYPLVGGGAARCPRHHIWKR